jgi:hypothetical protein
MAGVLSRGRQGKLACRGGRRLQALDGRRVAPGRKRLGTDARTDGVARSVRAIGKAQRQGRVAQPLLLQRG